MRDGLDGKHLVRSNSVSKYPNPNRVMLNVLMDINSVPSVDMTVTLVMIWRALERTFVVPMENGPFLKLLTVLSANVLHLIHLFLVISAVQKIIRSVPNVLLPVMSAMNSLAMEPDSAKIPIYGLV